MHKSIFFLIILFSLTTIAQNTRYSLVEPEEKTIKFESENYSYSDNNPGVISHYKKTEILLINDRTWKFSIPTKNSTLEINVMLNNESLIKRIFTVNDKMDFSGYLVKEDNIISLLLRNRNTCEKIEIIYRNVKKIN